MKKHLLIDARESGTSTGTYVDNLVRYLHKLNPPYQVTILTKHKRVEFMKSIAPKFEVHMSPFKEFTFREQLGLLGQIKKLRPDLVHFGMVQQPILYRGKTVTTMHDLTTIRFTNPAKNWLVFKFKQLVYKWLNRVVARKSTAIITPTEFVKEDVAKFARVNSSKIHVTYEAADKIIVPPEPVEGLEGKSFLLFVGRPQPHKNLRKLIDAFVELKKSHKDLVLALAGKTDLAYLQLAHYAKKAGVGDDVIFTGWADDSQKRWLYEHTKLYVFPSLSEGFGLPGLEAMAHGAPVVSSNTTCLPEVYKDSVLYFDPTSQEEMVATIQKVLGSKSVAETLRRKGAALVKQYSWERMARQTLDIYKKILDD